jgi:hypothetical protein
MGTSRRGALGEECYSHAAEKQISNKRALWALAENDFDSAKQSNEWGHPKNAS